MRRTLIPLTFLAGLAVTAAAALLPVTRAFGQGAVPRVVTRLDKMDDVVANGGKVPLAALSVMGASGPGHAPGLVPDPGATAGTTLFLRQDGGWAVPAGTGNGTVTSVSASVPPWLSVAVTNPTTTPAVAVTAPAGQAANQFLATPTGSTGPLALRGIVAADLPSLPESQVTNLTADLAARLAAANNLSDLGNPATARTNLGLGAAATQNTSAFLQPGNNLSDVSNAVTSRTNLGLGSAATQATAAFAQVANNLSDLPNAAAARANLGLGTAATQPASAFAATANNLSDLGSAATARTNLGLGTAATASASSFANALTPTAVKTASYTLAAGDLAVFDLSGGSLVAALPTAPPDKTRVALKIIATAGSNTLTMNTGGSDVFNKAGGSTSGTLSLLNQSVGLQYAAAAAIWYVVADDLSLSQLDARYANASLLTSGTVAAARLPTTGLNITSHYGTITTDADGATVTMDLAVSDWHQVQIAGNRNLAVANATVGQQFSVIVQQDATGGRTVGWFTTVLWAGGTPPALTMTANKRDVFTFKCISTNTFLGFVSGQNF